MEEGEDITLICIVSGKPQPITTWTKIGDSEVLSNTSSLTIVNVRRPGTPDNMIQYQCRATNGVETPATKIVNVIVHCKSVFFDEYVNFTSFLKPSLHRKLKAMFHIDCNWKKTIIMS